LEAERLAFCFFQGFGADVASDHWCCVQLSKTVGGEGRQRCPEP